MIFFSFVFPFFACCMAVGVPAHHFNTYRKCPQTLVAPIIKLALDQTQQTLRKSPEHYGYLAKTNGKWLKHVQNKSNKDPLHFTRFVWWKYLPLNLWEFYEST